MTNHTILTIGAFLILTTVLIGLYRLLGTAGDDVGNAQDMILATTLTTSHLELAQGMAFDEVTDSSYVEPGYSSLLTPVASLGPDGSDEDSVGAFNDFDDFNGLKIEKTATGSNKRFASKFRVAYVNVGDVDQVSGSQTFMKRMDVTTWRSFPPLTEEERPDTLRMSICMGYFHFD